MFEDNRQRVKKTRGFKFLTMPIIYLFTEDGVEQRKGNVKTHESEREKKMKIKRCFMCFIRRLSHL
jgi:hypothetical protein